MCVTAIDIGAAAFSNDNVPAVIDQVGYPSGSSFSSGSFHDANSFGSNGVQVQAYLLVG